MNFSDFQCQYLDTHNSQKSVIYDYGKNDIQIKNGTSFFTVSTCLRHEIYTFKPINLETHQWLKDPKKSLTRLMRLLCGLESDILGEQEILFQTERGVRHAFDQGTLNRPQLDAILDVIVTAESLRQKYNLTSKENYSTIAAKLLAKHFASLKSPTLVVVGAGYMSRCFLENFNLENIHIIWINRNLEKIKKNHADILNACADYKLTLPEELPSHINDADGIFVAVSHYPNSYNDSNLTIQPTQLVIDVSYPIVFNTASKKNILNLSNTKFQKHMASPLSDKIINEVHAEIERTVDTLVKKGVCNDR